MSFLTRLLSLTAMAAATVLTAAAQHGSGHMYGGHVHGGHFPARTGRAFPGLRPLPGPIPGHSELRPPVSGFYGINPGALNTGRHHRGRINGGFFLPAYYPPVIGYNDMAQPSPPSAESSANAEAMVASQYALVDQIQKLSDEIDQLKLSQQPQTPAYSPQDESEETSKPQVPVTLVLRNGQQLQVQSYAVMGQTFWDFTQTPARKIPLSNIDMGASAKATQANGGEFPQLDSSK